MRLFEVFFYMVNSRGTVLGSEPICFKFYAPTTINLHSKSFARCCLDFGRSLGFTGSSVEFLPWGDF